MSNATATETLAATIDRETSALETLIRYNARTPILAARERTPATIAVRINFVSNLLVRLEGVSYAAAREELERWADGVAFNERTALVLAA